MKIAAIINGSSKQAQRVRKNLSAFADILVFTTKTAGDTGTFARNTVLQKFDLVIVAGGDGTLNQVVNTWMKYASNQLPSLAVYPIGSANDFARTIGFSGISTIIENAQKHRLIQADVLMLKAEGQSRFCLNMSNSGIGANIAKTVARRRLKWPSKINYLMATISWLRIYKAPKVALRLDDRSIETQTFLTAIGNGKYAGDGLGLCPQAAMDNGKLAVTVIGKVGVFDFIKYLPKLQKAKRINDPRISYFLAEKLTITSLEKELAIETDGEFFISLQKGQQVTVQVIKSALRIVSSN